MAKSLAIIGAGAKAAAIVARAVVLKDLLTLGEVPELFVFERHEIGAAWRGDRSHSSGFLTLCTPGEKDVGFPYDETDSFGPFEAPVAPALYSRFSWSAFQVATGKFANWVDRGRDHPIHREWADYLTWVFSEAGQDYIIADVTSIELVRGRWRVNYNDAAGNPRRKVVDGVVLTGTGRPNEVAVDDNVPLGRVLNSETVWSARATLQQLSQEEDRVAVAGDGGAAGTIIAWLAEQYAENDAGIISISGMGTLFPRGDGYAERRWFSDPSDWANLTESDRKKLIGRTEAGVISMRIKHVIDQAEAVEYTRGKAVLVRWDQPEGKLAIDVDYDGDVTPVGADYFINAIGFDKWSCLDLVSHASVQLLCDPSSVDQRREVEVALEPDLSLPDILGLPSGLHVPALGALRYGPGIPNLGCLGIVAKAILEKYC